MEPGLYDENNKLLYNWNELIEEQIVELSENNDGDIGFYFFEKVASKETLILPENIAMIEYDVIGISLGKLYIPKSVKEIDTDSKGIGPIVEFEVNDNNPYYSSENGILFNKDKTKLIRYPGLKKDKKYTIPDSVEIIGKNAFLCCEYLEEIIFGSNVKIVEEYAFYNSQEIEKVELNEGLECICQSAFEECSNLSSIHIPSTLVNMDFNIFDFDYNLKEITVSNKNPKFDSRNNCNAIIETADNKIIFGSKNTTIPKDIEIIGSGSLSLRSGILVIPKNIKKMESGSIIGCNLEKIKYQGSRIEFEQIEGYKDFIWELRNTDVEVEFQKTLDKLIEEGYSLRDANKILRDYESER